MAVLKKLTRLAPEVGNTTRWTSCRRMIHNYGHIRSDLIAASQEDDASIHINTSVVFKKRSEKISGLFQDIKVVAWSLQYESMSHAFVTRISTNCSLGVL